MSVRNHGVQLSEFGPRRGMGAGIFDGRGAFLEVDDHPILRWGTRDFTVAAWVHAGDENGDAIGDVVAKFDPDARKGFHLGILTNSGVTSTTQPNYRNLHFGIDDRRPAARWTDCGQPGRAVLVAALKVAKNRLYAGTLEAGAEERGHLWRYEGGRQWVDLGAPIGCNVVNSVAEFDGALYCGVGRYMGVGSALGELPNRTPGGQVYRLDEDGRWTRCGHPGAEDATPEDVPTVGYASGKADDAFALTVYRGRLYCASNHRRGALVYQGGEAWEYIGPDLRILSFTVYRGSLYALINGGPVYRYEGGSEWVYCGCPTGSTQTYGAVTAQGRLYVGTWPEGDVHRYEGGETWASLGRVGYEREVMAMALYNGKAYVGSLPMANVWRMDGEQFTFMGTLDFASAPLRRVWSMAVFRGQLFAGTLPSGRVYSMEAGAMATWDSGFPTGWRHVAAIRDGGRLALYVDGGRVATSASFAAADYDLDTDRPLTIGFGVNDCFSGLLSDLRLYRRALGDAEVARLARR
ncbi:MAG TPA: LamG domain-containing protein [Methylomirabilota bacterium]|nr:LamG domain-containing protein [Methylomirabilota bacterium]